MVKQEYCGKVILFALGAQRSKFETLFNEAIGLYFKEMGNNSDVPIMHFYIQIVLCFYNIKIYVPAKKTS